MVFGMSGERAGSPLKCTRAAHTYAEGTRIQRSAADAIRRTRCQLTRDDVLRAIAQTFHNGYSPRGR